METEALPKVQQGFVKRWVSACSVMGMVLLGSNGNIALRQEDFLTLAQLFGLEVFSAGPYVSRMCPPVSVLSFGHQAVGATFG